MRVELAGLPASGYTRGMLLFRVYRILRIRRCKHQCEFATRSIFLMANHYEVNHAGDPVIKEID